MDRQKRKGFIREFKKLNVTQKREIILLLREFENILNSELYHIRCPIKRTLQK